MILLIDNYDSFTYNIVQALGALGADLRVERNDKISLDEIARGGFSKIVISPGPCTPDEAGISVDLIKRFAGKLPILGICLGHQSLAQAFGGKVVRAPQIMHGKTSDIHHDGKNLFKGLSNPFVATRYHSLTVDPESVPGVLEVSAKTDDGVIMGLRHKEFCLEGVQFHPESILTKEGEKLFQNFLNF